MEKLFVVNKFKNCYNIEYNNKNYLVNFRNHKIILQDNNLLEKINKMDPSSLDWLIYDGMIDEDKINIRISNYEPTVVTFLMTTDCNLNCIYCYANNYVSESLQFSFTRPCIDYIVSNALKKCRKSIIVKFHGAGEPTLRMGVIKEIKKYTANVSRNNHIDVKFHITTNGVMKEEDRKWLAENMDYIAVSFDGLEEYQNFQRPHRILNSFEEVIKSLEIFKAKKVNFGIRTTVTEININQLYEWAKFLTNVGVKKLNIEPVSICGSCFETKIKDVDCNDFIDSYIKLKEYGKQLGINISYSGIKLNKTIYLHCGGYGSNFVVTPDNSISTCYEVFDGSIQSCFFIGRVTQDKVTIDMQRVETLRNISLNNRSLCEGCFAEFQCGGGCISRALSNNEMVYKSVETKCKITKSILLHELKQIIDASNFKDNIIYNF